MREPTLELQKAVIAKLLQSGPLMELVQDRVFDDVPPGAGFPRITYGDEDVSADDFDCVVSHIVFLPIHIWSTKIGKPECKEIAGMVRNILHEEELSLTGYNLLSLHHDTTRYLRDPDGKTNHGVVTFRAMIDELPLVTEGVAAVIPDWVPDGAYMFWEPGNYWAAGAESDLASMFSVNPVWASTDPPLVEDGDAYSTFIGIINAAFMPDIIANGCTIVTDVTANSSTFVSHIWQLTDVGIATAEFRVRETETRITRPTGGTLTNNVVFMTPGRHKLAVVLVPGTEASCYYDGAQVLTGSLSAFTPDELRFNSSNMEDSTRVHSATIYLGALSQAECEALTA